MPAGGRGGVSRALTRTLRTLPAQVVGNTRLAGRQLASLQTARPITPADTNRGSWPRDVNVFFSLLLQWCSPSIACSNPARLLLRFRRSLRAEPKAQR